MLLSGVLADHVFTTAMQTDTVLARVFGGVVGTEGGSGVALIIVLSGVIGIIVGLIGYLIPSVRHIEADGSKGLG
jgi:MFS transporter, DHA3 family, macrolide efflux protein